MTSRTDRTLTRAGVQGFPVLERTARWSAPSISRHTPRTTRNELRDKYLPKLRRMARQISQAP
jgi:hypothetical protein